MKNQNKILSSLIGKKINAICFKNLEHSPIPNPNRDFITYDNELLLLLERENYWDENYLIKGKMVDFLYHSNIYKMQIEVGNYVKPRKMGGYILDESFRTKLNLNFEIKSIHLYEETFQNVDINEIKSKEILPSNIIIKDTSGIQSIIINCYEIPGEQSEIEMRVKFHLGEIYTENKINTCSEMKYINMFGKAN